MKVLSFITTPPLSFKSAELGEMLRASMDRLRDGASQHWERTLRAYFDEHELGWPTPETLRNHGLWMFPHASQARGLMHRLFAWRGQIIFEGWADATTGKHVIHPHTPLTPKPWDQPAGRSARAPFHET